MITPQQPVDYVAHQPAQLHRLTTYTGRSIEATGTQRFLTRTGWRPLSSLGPTDSVAIVAEYPALFGRGHADPDFLQALAYLTAKDAPGDGTTARIDDPDVRAEFEMGISAKGDECQPVPDPGHGTAVRLRVHGLHGTKSRVLAYLEMVGAYGIPPAQRFVPDFVFGLRRDKLRLFLNRSFSADGSVEPSGRIRYRTASVRMARQLQHLLSRFGVNCLLRGLETAGQLTAVDLEISTKTDVVRFIDEIGFTGSKADRAEHVREAMFHMRMIESIDWLGPIVFDRVWNVEETVMAPAYDLVFERAHNFIANDFVVRAGDGISRAEDSAWPADETTAVCGDDDTDDADECPVVAVVSSEGHA